MQPEPVPWESYETPSKGKTEGPIFESVDEDHYRLIVAEQDVTFEIDRLRRERHQLIGELSVRCNFAGALTIDGILSIGEMNLSSVRARQDRARYLASRARATSSDIDWVGLLEELAQRVLAAERKGQPSIDLRALPRSAPDELLEIDGLVLPRRHPSILFGDGGAAKSYLSLYFIGCLAKLGLRVALFDWELAGEDHRDRLERLFAEDMPPIVYARCERPLTNEVDRLRRIVREEGIEFAVFDSLAFGADGPPEAAEVAGRYFRAVRQIGVGSLLVAHITKGEGGDQKPFGSTFWSNGARATWFIKLAETTPDGREIHVGLFNRKSNLSALRSPLGFQFTFGENETICRRVDVADIPDLAARLPVRQRMLQALRQGALSPEVLAGEIDAGVETVKRTARRYREQFTVLDGGQLGLLERRA